MNVLVTGATGFLGSHLVKALVKEGHRVIILKRSFSSITRIADVLPYLLIYDIDKTRLELPFQENDVDAVIHTAACYGRNKESFTEIVDANVVFPLQLLETAASYQAKIFINTDTFSNIGKRAANLPGYHLTKKQFVEWGKTISDQCKIQFMNVRLEHLYGPLDSDAKFVMHVIKCCLQNVSELLLTHGEQRRDFIYVDDVVSAYLTLLSKATDQQNSFAEYQVGTGMTTSIREIVELVHRITDSKTILKFGALPYRKNEIMYSQANIHSLAELGWSSRVSIVEGIRATIKQAMAEQ